MIAQRLGIALPTVKSYIHRIAAKCDIDHSKFHIRVRFAWLVHTRQVVIADKLPPGTHNWEANSETKIVADSIRIERERLRAACGLVVDSPNSPQLRPDHRI